MSILYTNGDNETDGGALELDGVSAIASADVGGTTYVFVAGGLDNGISVFSLGLNGALANTANITDSGALNLTGVSGLTTITSDGNTYLVAAGAGDSGLSVFRVNVGGSLTPVYNLADGGALNLSGVSRVSSATVSGNAYVFAAGTNDDGISVFRVQGNGTLTSVFDLADNGTFALNGVKGLATAVIGGSTYLFAAGGVDDGLSVFSVAANGALTNTANVTDNGTLRLDGASDVATAVVGGTTYVFVTGANDNGVSVFSVNASGQLTNTANVGDSASLRLAGATGLSVNTFGTTTYLTVGGTESGVSLFRVNAGGTLTAMDNIDDGGSRELASGGGTTAVHSATVGGANYVIAGGSVDDGVSTLGLKPTGQLWYATEGGDADTRIVRINNDGSSHTVNVDNGGAGTGDDHLISSFTADIGLDTAAGFYFAVLSSQNNDVAYLVRGVIGSSATPTTVVDFPDNIIVNTIEVDPINHRIYAGYQDGSGTPNGNITGIRVYSYNPLNGAVTDLGFLTTAVTDNRANESGFYVLDPQDFALDSSIGRLFYTERVDGLVTGIYRLDLASPNTTTQLVSQAQFPDNQSAGIIMDVEVDESTDLVYFTTHSQFPSPDAGYNAAQNALWYISENASSGTAVKVTLVGLPGGGVFYPGDMTFDQNTRQLYIENEETGTIDTDDVIYVFQLDGAGTTATLINTITPNLTASGSNIEGLVFSDLPVLSGLSGTGTTMNEQQAAATTLLTGAPTITDTDGDHLASATVQITGGKFSSNESSTTDDHLGYSAAKQISGLVSGTNITLAWDASSETLTLTGYDTIANYQAVLAAITYWTTGDNPTNYGLNTNRTITWTVSDGTPDVPGGAVNSGTTTINIAAVNDAPVNGTVSSATGFEDTSIAITGLQLSDVDANPALQTVSVTLSVTKGVLSLLTNVTNGLTSGQITGNGTDTVTISASLNAINATLAAASGLVFLGDANVNGTDTLTVVTDDGGGTGSGGALSDTDFYTITINGVNDAPVVAGDGTETLASTNEDVANAALTNTVSSLFSGQFDDSADQVSGGTSANAFAGVAVVANGSTAGTGQWQYYNGSSWVNIGAASTAAAVTIAASAPIRFLPATDFNGPAPSLTLRLVDSSGGALTNGAVVNTTTNGGSTVYSAGTVVLDHGVTAVNDAPTVTGGSTASLTSIGEDSAPGAGETISSLFSSHFSDAKDQVSGGSSADAFTGVAVSANAATAAQGVYQYFEGGSWHDLPAVSTASAFILDATTLLRFVPAADYSGTAPGLTVSMIEDSSGAVTTGQTADLTTTGGSTQYSASMTLNIVVTPTNDAPVATGSATLSAVAEDTANPSGATVSTLFGSHFSDPDGDSLAGVAIVGNGAASEGAWQYFATGSWHTIGSPSEASALVLTAATLIRFLPAANFNGAVPALTAYLVDSSGAAINSGDILDVSTNGGQTRFSDASLTLSTSVTAVNDTPVVPASATTVGATEQTAATLLGSLTVSDVDLDALNGGNGDYAGASFTVQRASASAADAFAFASGGLFTVSGANLQVGGLTFATFTAVGGVLTISFTSSAATATTALVNDVLDHISYTNTSDAPPASVTLNYALDDGAPGAGQGAGGSASAGGSVLVNITAVNDVHTGGAALTGTAAEDQVLTAVSTLADPDGIGTLHYQWQHDLGGGYVNVGADQATYTLGDGDIGGVVRVIISYTDAGGTVESATSGATATITATNDAPTGGATITGTATENQVLTADTSTLADSDGLGTLHYDWQRNTGSGFVSTGAADQATYTLGDADVGGTVRVVVSYTDGQGFANSVTSAASAAISGVNDPHTGGASITGTATEDQVLTAVSTLADVDGLGTLHYQWQHDVGSGYVNVGTDQSTYTLGDADVGGLVRVVISYTDGQGFAESSTSAATATIANINDVPTGGVSITGAATENQVLTADTSTLADGDGLGTLHYQWQRNTGSGFFNVGADQATYTLGDADVGGTVRVVVSYTDGHATAESATSAASAAIAGVNDPHTGGAAITGTATENQVLTAVSTLADVDGLGTLHYQWQHDVGSGYVNVGTDQATYTLGDADVGGTVRVVISYTDGQGFAESSTSAATAAIANVNDIPTGGVSITGTAAEDHVLTADTSTLADGDGLGTLHYQWQSDTGSGFVNVGADQSTYALGDGDIGAVIRVVVSYTDGHATAETAFSGSTDPVVASNDPYTGGVTITGVAAEDEVLTADTSTLADPDGLGTLYYEWQRDFGSGFASVDGADQATYTLGDADIGAQIRVVIYYADGQGFFETVTSAATTPIANINDPHTGGAAITGTATEDQVLTAVSTIVDDDGWSTLHYQWQRDTGSGFVNVGNDQATYTLGDADVGGTVRVVISYTDDHGTAESSTSASTATIANVNDVPTGGVAITGAATENQVLTAISTLADVDGLGTLHYQWQRNIGSGFVNVGADQATYTLGDADVGGTVRVVVSYTDGHATAESKTSAGTAAIAGVNDPHTGGAAITGTATENQVLTAVSTLADVDGLGTLHYDWQRNTGSGFVSTGAADQSIYTLGDADVGGTMRVVISYTDGQGFAESSTSAATAAIANVNDPHTGGVAVSGATYQNQVLTAVSTLADADGLGTLHYQWQRDSGSGFVNVGSDQSTYALAAGDVGAVIRVVTSYTDGHGTAESATSAATATILPANGPHTGGVSVTGTAAEDQVLTANTASLADPGGLGVFHYQWQRSTVSSGYVNVGTDQATYTLGDADVGAQIRVIVSYTDGQGVFESETSGPTSAVANVNDAPTGMVTITGAATEDQVLTAASTLADVDGLGALHYQWQRNAGSGFVNVGNDQATYALGDADVGGTVRVVVSYTDGHGTAESQTSAATAAIANVNDAPTAANDAGSVAQRLTLTGSVRANDGDIDNALATLTVTNVAYNATHVDQAVVSGGTVVNGAYGKLTINPNGSYSYVADHEGLVVGQVVTDTFDYTIKDPSGASAAAQLTVTVTGSATGDANANILISDGSAHTLTGKGGADTLTGGGGADVFAYEAIGDSTVAAFDTITDFTHGSDTLGLTPLMTGTTKLTLSTDGTDKILSIDLNGDGVAEGQIKSLGQGLEVTDIVTGVANFGFIINGSSGGDTLTGGSGADTISGANGADSIRGGGGGDTLTGGAGVDTFLYGAGDSSVLQWDTITDFATGQDKLDISAVDAGTVAIARFGSSTFVYFGSGASASVVQVSGDIKFTDLIVSGAVHGYTLYAGSGVETLTGSAGADVLVGGSGSTTLNGGGGADILYGGTGNDTFQYTAISQSNFANYDTIFGFDSGHDKVDISAIDGGKITIARYEGTTFIYSAPDGGGNSQAVVAVSGTSLKATDLVTSGGASQAFVLVGDGASHNVADTLVGAAGNDILYGLDGNDILTGAGGADFMLGGAGADTFVYTSAGESSPFVTDLIFDFSTAQADKLDLSGIDANSGTGANDAFSVVTSFSGVAGQLTIAAPDSSGYYHVSGDVNGDGVADFVIALNVTGTLTSADILL
ncbi:MAG TPA: M10 family metallopeptidase C-terminal domain-containing protein [Caulobacter sp.]|nr:M10 family metallopeptidase C-terminal domain-containing protein [Caulobacter sp.]